MVFNLHMTLASICMLVLFFAYAVYGLRLEVVLGCAVLLICYLTAALAREYDT